MNVKLQNIEITDSGNFNSHVSVKLESLVQTKPLRALIETPTFIFDTVDDKMDIESFRTRKHKDIITVEFFTVKDMRDISRILDLVSKLVIECNNFTLDDIWKAS